MVFWKRSLLLLLTVGHLADKYVSSATSGTTFDCSSVQSSEDNHDLVAQYHEAGVYDVDTSVTAVTDDYTIREYHRSWRPYDYYDTPLPKCNTADENTHGTYSSDLSPCEIAFHISDVPNDENGFNLLVPEACTTDNRVVLSGTNTKTISQSVFDWKDECIGDFTRCYSLATDQRIFLSLVCRKKWKKPLGATHMSVNCTKDKLLKVASVEKLKSEQYESDHKYISEEQRSRRQLVALIATILAVLVLSCVGCCVFSYCCVIKPYFAMSQSVKRSEVNGLISHRSNEMGTTLAQVEIA